MHVDNRTSVVVDGPHRRCLHARKYQIIKINDHHRSAAAQRNSVIHSRDAQQAGFRCLVSVSGAEKNGAETVEQKITFL